MSEHISKSEAPQAKAGSFHTSNKMENVTQDLSIDTSDDTALKALENVSEKSGIQDKVDRFQEIANSSPSLNRSSIAQLQEAADRKTNGLTQLQSTANNFQQSKGSVSRNKSNGSGLPAPLKSGIESLSGMRMDDIKVHYNSSQPAQLQAHAFARGNDIHLASGQEKHLPHEAWHTVQQKQGRVQPTRQLKSKVAINDNRQLEKEADDMGSKALSLGGKSSPSALDTITSGSKNVAQLEPKGFIHSEGFQELKERLHGTVTPEKEEDNPQRTAGERPGNLSPTDDNYSAAKGLHIDPDSKASPILKMENDLEVEKFYADNPAYGTIGYKKTEGELTRPKFDKSENMDRLDPFFMESAKEGAFSKFGFHVTPNKFNASSVAKSIDPSFHNENGRFGGGFHVAESVSTGAMELHEHRFDLKKSAYKKQEGTEKDKQRAYKNAELLKPTNVLKYSVELKDSNILDTTRKGLTAIAKNTPKMIEKAARMDGYDGIIFKSMRGPGKNMVVYKNYHKIFTLHNKKKEVDDPTPFDKYDQGEMKEMLKHEEYERTGISKRLYEKGQQKGDGKAVRRPSFFNRFKNLFSGRR